MFVQGGDSKTIDQPEKTTKLQAWWRGVSVRRSTQGKTVQEALSTAKKIGTTNQVISPFVPSSPQMITTLVTLAKVQPTDIFLDIGCGDGRVCRELSIQAGCQSIGIDKDNTLTQRGNMSLTCTCAYTHQPPTSSPKDIQRDEAVRSSDVCSALGVSNNDKVCHDLKCQLRLVSLRQMDADDEKAVGMIINQATVIYLFMLPEALRLVERLILSHARPGTRVISAIFRLSEGHQIKNQCLLMERSATVDNRLTREGTREAHNNNGKGNHGGDLLIEDSNAPDPVNNNSQSVVALHLYTVVEVAELSTSGS